MVQKIKSQTIRVNDVDLHFLSEGKGDAILFIHGWPTSAILWRNVMAALAKHHHVIAIDLPGYGKSDKRHELSYSFRFYNDIITGLLDHLNVEKINLGVHDLGGPVGLSWMVNNMSRVDRLILTNTLVYPQFSFAVKLFGLATMLPGIRSWISSPRGIAWSIKFGVYQKNKLAPSTIKEYQSYFLLKENRKPLLKSVQRLSMKGYQEIAEKLKLFKGPVQIIYGAHDRILPKVAHTMERVKKDLPQANINVLENCGHFIQEEEPEKIGELINQFMLTTKAVQ